MVEVVVTTGDKDVHSSSQLRHHQRTDTRHLQAGCPSCPTNSVRALKGESITFHGLAHPSSPGVFHHRLDHSGLLVTLPPFPFGRICFVVVVMRKGGESS